MVAQKYRIEDVFTPTKPARATFVERTAVNDKLVKALVTPGKQIVVYGHSGSGKTTLLVNKLDQLYEDHIVTRCTSSMSFDQIMLNGFDELDPYYNSEKVKTKTSKISSSLTSEYALIKSSISGEISGSTQTKDQRILPPQLTPQTLARLLGEANCCWVLEDFHKIESAEKVHLAQAMKLFVDMADKYPSVRIIAIGAVNTAREVIEYDAEMRNRVTEIEVPLMTLKELDEIVQKGQELLNFDLHRSVKTQIGQYSNGLASVCHQLCFNICFAADIVETLPKKSVITSQELEKAVEMYLDEASDTVKGAFDKALKQRRRKYENGKLILQALTKFDQNGATYSQILKSIQAKEPDYPQGNLTAFLPQLQTEEKGKLLRYDNASGKYAFTDPIYRVFAMGAFGEKSDPVDFFGDSLEIKLSDETRKKMALAFEKLAASLAVVATKL